MINLAFEEIFPDYSVVYGNEIYIPMDYDLATCKTLDAIIYKQGHKPLLDINLCGEIDEYSWYEVRLVVDLKTMTANKAIFWVCNEEDRVYEIGVEDMMADFMKKVESDGFNSLTKFVNALSEM